LTTLEQIHLIRLHTCSSTPKTTKVPHCQSTCLDGNPSNIGHTLSKNSCRYNGKHHNKKKTMGAARLG